MEDSTTNVSVVNSSTIVNFSSSFSASEVKEETDDRSTVAIAQVGSSLKNNGINQMDFEIKKDYDSDCDCEDCRVQKAIAGIREIKPFVCERIKCRKLCVKKEENDDDDEITSKEVTGNQTNSEEEQVGNERSLTRKPVEGHEDANSPCTPTPDNVQTFISESDDDNTEIDDEMAQESVTDIVGQDESNPNDLDSENESEINTNQTNNSCSGSLSQVRRSTRMLGKPTKSYREEFFWSDNESDYELFDRETTDEDSEIEEKLISIKRKRHSSGGGDEDSGRKSSVGSNLNDNFKNSDNPGHTDRPFECEQCKIGCQSKSILLIHQRGVHLGLRPFYCIWRSCKYQSYSAKYSVQHVQKNHLKTNDICDPKKFIQKRTNKEFEAAQHSTKLRKSKQSYKINLNCLVDNCDKQFSDQIELNVHMEESHQINRFQCLVQDCNVSFKYNVDLCRHIKDDHKNVEKFVCSKCNSPYRNHPSLRQHNRNNHQIVNFSCNYPACGFECRTNKCSIPGHVNRHKHYEQYM